MENYIPPRYSMTCKTKRKRKRRKLYFSIFLFAIMFIGIASAIEVTPITTPSGRTSNTSFSATWNVSAPEGLSELIYNFNNTNYSLCPSPTCVVWLNFDNRSSLLENATDVMDLSGNGNNFKVLNGLEWGANLGKQNGGFNFTKNVTADIKYINRSAVITNLTANWTVSFWLKAYPHTYGDYSTVLSLFGHSGWFRQRSTTQNCFMNINHRNSTGSTHLDLTLTAAGACTNGVWHHVVGTRMHNNYTIYVDGIKYENKLGNESLIVWQGTRQFMIGADNNYPQFEWNYLNGSIDDVIVWNRTLSDADITNLYKMQMTKYDTGNFTLQVNQTINYTTLNSSNQQEIYSYNVYAKNTTTTINNSQNTLTRIIKSVSNIYSFATLIGTVNKHFYGSIGSNYVVDNWAVTDTDGDGTADGVNNATEIREAWDNAKLTYSRIDMSIHSLYRGVPNKDAENWGDILARHISTTTTSCFPIGWHCNEGINAGGELNISRVSTKHNGDYGVTIINNGTEGMWTYFLLDLLNQSNYTWSIWINSTNTTTISVQKQKTGDFTTVCTNTSVGTSVWQYITCNFTANENEDYAFIITLNEGESLTWDETNVTKDDISLSYTKPSESTLNNYRNLTKWADDNGYIQQYITTYTPYFLANLSQNCTTTSGREGFTCPPTNYTLYADLVIDFINSTVNSTQYDSIDIEIWNEPYGPFLMPSDDYTQAGALRRFAHYKEIYNITYTKIKAFNSNITIGGPSGYLIDEGTADRNFTNWFIGNFTGFYNSINLHNYNSNMYSDMESDLNKLEVVCTANNANCSKIIWSEWNLLSGGYTYGDKEASGRYSQGYLSILKRRPQDIMLTYKFSDMDIYNANYAEYPSKWHMMSQRTLDDEFRPQYNVTFMFARYAPAQSSIYNVTTDDSEVIATSSRIGSTESIIITNTASEARNITITTSGLTKLIDVESDTIYDVSDNSAELGIIDPYEIIYLTEGRVTHHGNGTDYYYNYFDEYLTSEYVGQDSRDLQNANSEMCTYFSSGVGSFSGYMGIFLTILGVVIVIATIGVLLFVVYNVQTNKGNFGFDDIPIEYITPIIVGVGILVIVVFVALFSASLICSVAF